MKFLKEEHNAYQYNGHTVIQTSSGYRIKDGKGSWIGGEFDTDADAKEYINSLKESLDDDSYYRYVASKSVQDSDGFYTDYTWYKTRDGLNVFVFGDSDIYTPEGGYYDHEEENDDAAQEWFDCYNGFEDDILDEDADVHLKLSGDMIEIPIEDNSEVGELGHPIQQGIGDPRAKREKELQEATAVMDKPLSTFSGTLSSVLLAHKDEVDTLFDKQAAIEFLDRIMPEVKNKGYVEKVKQEVMRGKRSPVEYFYNIILKGDGDGTEKGGAVTKRAQVRKWARENLSEGLWEKGDYVTLWWRDPEWSKTAPCYASCVFAGKARSGMYKFVSETYGWTYLLDVERQTITTPSGKTFAVDNSSGWLKTDISEGWIARYVPERGDKVQIIGGVYTDSRMEWQTDTDEFIGETGTISYAGSRYSTFDSVEIELDNGTKVWTAHGYKPLERNPLKESMDDPKQWPDNKELTYDEAMRLAMAYYGQGGDGFYETTEKYQFEDEVKMFGPKTVGQMKRDFGVFDSVAKDRMTEDYNIQYYQVLQNPEKPTDNGKMVAQAGSEEEAHQKGKKLCGDGNYLIKAVCDDGKVRYLESASRLNEGVLTIGNFLEAYNDLDSSEDAETIKLIDMILDTYKSSGRNNDLAAVYNRSSIEDRQKIYDLLIDNAPLTEDMDDWALSVYNDDELLTDNVWSVSDALEFIHSNGGNIIKCCENGTDRIIWKDGKAVGGGFIGMDYAEDGSTIYAQDGEDVPTHEAPKPFNALEWMYGKNDSITEAFNMSIDLDSLVSDVGILLDTSVLGEENWIEVFPTSDARPISNNAYHIPLEITGPNDDCRRATFTARGGVVDVRFRNGSEAKCYDAKEIARFIAGEFGLSLNESTCFNESNDASHEPQMKWCVEIEGDFPADTTFDTREQAEQWFSNYVKKYNAERADNGEEYTEDDFEVYIYQDIDTVDKDQLIKYLADQFEDTYRYRYTYYKRFVEDIVNLLNDLYDLPSYAREDLEHDAYQWAYSMCEILEDRVGSIGDDECEDENDEFYESKSMNEGMNTYNVTFYMASLDDQMPDGPTTTKTIYAASEEDAEKKLMSSSNDKYYIPTVTKVELVESKKLREGTKQKRIACTTEFDNGNVIHNDWQQISDEEAEELAKQRSIENPDKVYYVKYDDIMNPCSDYKWKNGQCINESLKEDYISDMSREAQKVQQYLHDNGFTSALVRIGNNSDLELTGYYEGQKLYGAVRALADIGYNCDYSDYAMSDYGLVAEINKIKDSNEEVEMAEAYVENPRELMKYKREDGAVFDEETGKWIKIDYTDDGEPIEVDAGKPEEEGVSLKEELWDSSRVIDLVNYYLDRGNPEEDVLIRLIMKKMKEEGSTLPYNIADFYDAVYRAIHEYNSQFDDEFNEYEN